MNNFGLLMNIKNMMCCGEGMNITLYHTVVRYTSAWLIRIPEISPGSVCVMCETNLHGRCETSCLCSGVVGFHFPITDKRRMLG